jgi:hypothetical protein
MKGDERMKLEDKFTIARAHAPDAAVRIPCGDPSITRYEPDFVLRQLEPVIAFDASDSTKAVVHPFGGGEIQRSYPIMDHPNMWGRLVNMIFRLRGERHSIMLTLSDFVRYAGDEGARRVESEGVRCRLRYNGPREGVYYKMLALENILIKLYEPR